MKKKKKRTNEFQHAINYEKNLDQLVTHLEMSCFGVTSLNSGVDQGFTFRVAIYLILRPVTVQRMIQDKMDNSAYNITQIPLVAVCSYIFKIYNRPNTPHLDPPLPQLSVVRVRKPIVKLEKRTHRFSAPQSIL